ncbi:MAG: glycoside hydrolase [Oscillospiraceae bacterium]|nr:glycoside hydrolase [Oscillospiraceae bacterium]
MKEKKFIGRIKGLFESVSIEEKMSGKMIAMLFIILFSFMMIVICIITLTQQSFQRSDNKLVENPTVTTTEVLITQTETQKEEKKVTTISEYVLNTPLISQYDYQQLIEAESVSRPDVISMAADRAGFSGEGYLSGFVKGQDALKFEFEVPVSQHYDISICFAADSVVTNAVYLNEVFLFDFACTEETVGNFVVQTYYGVFLEEGKSVFSVNSADGNFELDYIRIQNNQSIYSSKTDISAVPINSESTEEVCELLQYLADNFGENIITGQYVSDSQNIEINKIYQNTAKYPVIRFGDLGMYSLNNASESVHDDDISAAIKWYKNGGMVGYIWHWKAPMNESDVYADNTSFKLENAVTSEDIALLPIDEIETLAENGMVTPECVALVKDIDHISEQLARLCDKGVPVLWRPLHEASGDWFWWGASGAESYKWLWELLYRRQTEYHKLNNLIWIWSAQGTEYFVGNDKFDIAAVDLYDQNTDNTSYYMQYQWLYSLTGGEKLIALSECGKLPDMELTFRDRAVWSFFGLWYGDYILSGDGELSEEYNSRDDILKMYNSNRTITLDEYIKRNSEPDVTTSVVTGIGEEISETSVEVTVTTVP